jgi:ATP-dependent exoDNAse (exonuclease V) beta subunit
MRPEAPDRAERERALDAGASFIVQAPAGSGKTELLIQRYLLLLARVERPEEIVAITFTRKAAAEMRKRILGALHQARADERPGEGHQARTWDLARAALETNDRLGWRLEENAARLRVQTIDALCVSLTRRMPIAARFGAQPESIDDATALYYEAARDLLLAVETSSDERETRDIALLLAHLDNNAQQAMKLLVEVLERRDHWMPVIDAGADREEIEAVLVKIREDAAARCRELYPEGPDRFELWQAQAKAFLTAKHEWRASAPKKLLENEELRQALEEVMRAPPPCYTDDQWEILQAILRLLRPLVAHLRAVFAVHGQCDFIEVSQGALQALGDADGPTDLLLALDYRIRHILVDEFQDTSNSQYMLLEKLTSGWERGDGRTLFLVGDPMQSIYRFRQAEVGLFLDARRRGLGTVELEPLTLRANFRSQPAIVGWVNGTFERILPAGEDIAAGAVAYSGSIAMPGSEGPDVQVHPFYGNDVENEAARLVRLVEEARARKPDATVAILVRARSHLNEIVPGLRRAGLRFRAVEIELLAQRPVVQDLLAITRALSHLGDRTAWLSLLRAPWCGLTLTDLCALGNRGLVWDAMHDEAKLAALSEDGRTRLAATRSVLARFVDERLRTSLREAVEGAWLGLRGPAAAENATELEDAAIYLDFLEANEEAGAIADPDTFDRRLEKLYAVPDLEADETLQVMTVHKAKGLEFDTVILPGLGRGADWDDPRLFLWLKRHAPGRGAELLIAPVNASGGEDDEIYQYIRRIDRGHGDHEIGRLLYVAATRARTALHVAGEAPFNRNGTPQARSGSLLKRLWPAVEARFGERREGAEPRDARGRRAPLIQALRRLATVGAPIESPSAVSWESAPEEPMEDTRIEFSWAGETARRIGTVAHRWLQRMGDEGLDAWSVEKVRSLTKVFAANLAAGGVPASEVDAATQAVASALENTLTDERGRWILGSHPQAWNEYRLTFDDGRARRTYILDRHFVDANGERWIVDYKTSRHEGAGLEAFLDEERSRYREQLARYARLFDGPSRQGLYFPLVPGWRECA